MLQQFSYLEIPENDSQYYLLLLQVFDEYLLSA